MENTALVARLDEAIAARNLLAHPFYQDWQAGTLRRAWSQLYAAQYYRHVEDFPGYLRALAGRTSGTLYALTLANLAEEENPAAPHPKLWRDFAVAVGVEEEALWMRAPLASMQRLVETYSKICRDGSFGEAVAVLYVYEAQGLAYFKVHEKEDRVHRAAWKGWLGRHGPIPWPPHGSESPRPRSRRCGARSIGANRTLLNRRVQQGRSLVRNKITSGNEEPARCEESINPYVAKAIYEVTIERRLWYNSASP